MRKERTVNNVSDFPICVQYKLCKIMEYIHENYNPERVLLLGSYAKGSYIDDFTEQEFIEAKAKAGYRVKQSDFDILIYPIPEEKIIDIENFRLHIWGTDQFYKQNTIELYVSTASKTD